MSLISVYLSDYSGSCRGRQFCRDLSTEDLITQRSPRVHRFCGVCLNYQSVLETRSRDLLLSNESAGKSGGLMREVKVARSQPQRGVGSEQEL